MEDTESCDLPACGMMTWSYSGLDPMEDTERAMTEKGTPALRSVTVGSIRWRILKVCRSLGRLGTGSSYSGLDPMEDTESSATVGSWPIPPSGYSGLDPMEDTESHCPGSGEPPVGRVTVGSIRWRILKEPVQECLHLAGVGLQWARSDGGY